MRVNLLFFGESGDFVAVFIVVFLSCLVCCNVFLNESIIKERVFNVLSFYAVKLPAIPGALLPGQPSAVCQNGEWLGNMASGT